MNALEDVKGYLMLSAEGSQKLYDIYELNPDPDNPSQDIAELETIINKALDKLETIK